MAEKKKSLDKWKKKKWFQIIAPKAFEERAVGETPAEKASMVMGRTIEITLSSLTGQRKHRHVKIKLRVNSVQETKAFTETIGHSIGRSYIRRLARRRQSKIDAVVKGKTKDGKRIAVTAVVLAEKTEREKERKIRKIMEKILMEETAKKEFELLMQEFLFGVTAGKIIKQAKEIARIKRVEIVKSRILEGKK